MAVINLASQQLSTADYTLVSVVDSGIETVAYFLGDQTIFNVLMACSLQVQKDALETDTYEYIRGRYPLGFFPHMGYYIYTGNGQCVYQEIGDSGRVMRNE